MISSSLGHQVRISEPPRPKSPSQFVSGWESRLPSTNWKNHPPKLPSWGIVLDSEAQRPSPPQDKLVDTLHMVQSWLGRHKTTKRELLSIVGKLPFAAKEVPAGRLFLRLLMDLSTTVGKLHHHIQITSDARADLPWWARFLPTWNGVAMFLDPGWISADTLNLFTNASGTLGSGAYFNGSCLVQGFMVASPKAKP